MKYKRIAIDTSKHVFTLHGVDDQERPILRRNLKRAEMETFFRALAPLEVVIEACGSAHHWGRLLSQLGHRVRLSALTACRCIGPLCGPIPAQYVKPFVKRSNNDRADAAAINDAASRPDMPTVPVKSADQQANGMILKHRALLIGQRTAAINARRGHAAEFGIIAGKGTAQIEALLAKLEDEATVPAVAKAMFVQMGEHIAALDQRIEALEQDLLARHKAEPMSQLLAAVPGIGPITAITLSLSVEPAHFAAGRHFAAWPGLTPKEHSTGGKPRLGKISKAGNERLRTLLVVGAMAVIRHAKPGHKASSAWLLQLPGRKPRKLAAVALANKMARIVWAMMVRGEAYRHLPMAA